MGSLDVSEGAEVSPTEDREAVGLPLYAVRARVAAPRQVAGPEGVPSMQEPVLGHPGGGSVWDRGSTKRYKSVKSAGLTADGRHDRGAIRPPERPGEHCDHPRVGTVVGSPHMKSVGIAPTLACRPPAPAQKCFGHVFKLAHYRHPAQGRDEVDCFCKCRERESNSHGLTARVVQAPRVYRFRHPGVGSLGGEGR